MKYIDADLLREEIDDIEEEARKVRVSKESTTNQAIGADGKVKLCQELRRRLNTLVVESEKPINLEQEIDKWLGIYRDSAGQAHDISDGEIVYDWKEDSSQCMNTELYIAFARHFYELGKNSK